jgi:hypothetical protein
MNIAFLAWMNFITYEMGDNPNYSPDLKNGWSILHKSGELGFNTSGFNGVSYVNYKEMKLVISYSGTTCFNMGWDIQKWYNCAQDMYANIQMYMGFIPSHQEDAKMLTDYSMESIDQIKNYNIILTGHSLGAVIASLVAVYLYDKCDKYKVVLFDSPGSVPAVSNYVSDKNLDLDDIKINVMTYNAPANLINTLNPHIGEIQMIDKMPYNSGNYIDFVMSTLFCHSIEKIYNTLDEMSQKDILDSLAQSQILEMY